MILFCNDSRIVSVILLVKTLLNLIRFFIPMILVVKIILDLYKNMINVNSKEDLLKQEGDRIFACIVVFLVPTLINLFLGFVNLIDAGVDTSDYTDNFLVCYNEASRELVASLQKAEQEKLDEDEANEKQKLEIANAKIEAEKKARNEEYSRNNSSNSGSNNSSGGGYNNTNNTKQNGGVYVKNGIFYYPSGASGKDCPTNPTSQGYNNPYGYHNEFWNRLQKFKQAAISNGYNIEYSTQGCRSYDSQVATAKKYANQKGRAATPGNSKHGFGIASDVTFYKNKTQKCGSSRTYSNCPGMKWAHENASKYGLTFPLLNASYKEDWHIQPLKIQKY